MYNSKEEAIKNFDPNGVGAVGTLFGLPFTPEQAQVVVIPVPWEVTVSYNSGTAKGPEAVLEASPQLDLHQPDIPDAWKMGLAMLPVSEKWLHRSDELRAKAAHYIKALEEDTLSTQREAIRNLPASVNEAGEQLTAWVKKEAVELIEAGKLPVVLGGDHSTPLGLMQAIAEEKGAFGILQIDAHADLRKAYEGFTYSHASIMYNALQIKEVEKLVQVGIRDICGAEVQLAQKEKERVTIFYDRALKEQSYEGKTWQQQVRDILEPLPKQVYVSFDIDGLDPKLCPGTGTPVPGGLEFEQAMYLLKAVVESGRTIVGFDLCEVAPGYYSDWNGNVGARVLYRLANLAGVSNGWLNLKK
ncbi:agmatinase family protein [Nafulsella turpanensis]|uniref:agmatinase family protein n=1 Tax=Nafulsella turpanensis TaxID=1265690 RepID=UPI0003499A0E|nr:agmatinase family protein [Nafulsella turpanensis]